MSCAAKEKIEIQETTRGYDVIDLEKDRWMASFRMFADAQDFAEAKIALKTAEGTSK